MRCPLRAPCPRQPNRWAGTCAHGVQGATGAMRRVYFGSAGGNAPWLAEFACAHARVVIRVHSYLVLIRAQIHEFPSDPSSRHARRAAACVCTRRRWGLSPHAAAGHPGRLGPRWHCLCQPAYTAAGRVASWRDRACAASHSLAAAALDDDSGRSTDSHGCCEGPQPPRRVTLNNLCLLADTLRRVAIGLVCHGGVPDVCSTRRTRTNVDIVNVASFDSYTPAAIVRSNCIHMKAVVACVQTPHKKRNCLRERITPARTTVSHPNVVRRCVRRGEV